MLSTDAAGGAAQINAYDAYGIPDDASPAGLAAKGRFRYTGQMLVPEAGLYHYKARMYAPALGRFLQPDPIGYQGGMNLYAYVGGDPVNRIDPWGMQIVVTGKRINPHVLEGAESVSGTGRLSGGAGSQIPSAEVPGADGEYQIVVLGNLALKQIAATAVQPGLRILRNRGLHSSVAGLMGLTDEHTKNARPSTRNKHEEANAARKAARDQTKASRKHRPPRKRPPGWKGGPWPPKKILIGPLIFTCLLAPVVCNVIDTDKNGVLDADEVM